MSMAVFRSSLSKSPLKAPAVFVKALSSVRYNKAHATAPGSARVPQPLARSGNGSLSPMEVSFPGICHVLGGRWSTWDRSSPVPSGRGQPQELAARGTEKRNAIITVKVQTPMPLSLRWEKKAHKRGTGVSLQGTGAPQAGPAALISAAWRGGCRCCQLEGSVPISPSHPRAYRPWQPLSAALVAPRC